MKRIKSRLDILSIILFFILALVGDYFESFTLIEDQLITFRQLIRNSFGKNSESFPFHQVSIVTINESFYRDYNGFPLKRKDLAKIVTNLKKLGAKVIVIDLLMEYPCTYQEDPILAQALSDAGNVILASQALVSPYTQKYEGISPPTDTLKEACISGYVNIVSTNSFVTFLNRLKIYPDIAKKDNAWPLAVQAVSSYLNEQPRIENNTLFFGNKLQIQLDRFYNMYIDFSPIPSFCQYLNQYIGISAIEFLSSSIIAPEEKRELELWVKDKIVIIGDTSETSHDWFDTPVGMVYGAELIADEIATILESGQLRPIPFWVNSIILMICLISLLILSRFVIKTLNRTIIALFFLITYICFCTIVYSLWGLIIPMSYTLLACFLAYCITIIQTLLNEQTMTKNLTGQLKTNKKILKITEDNYHNIFMNAIEGIFQVDAKGALISANPSFYKLLGYDEQHTKPSINLFEHINYNEDINQMKKLLDEQHEFMDIEASLIHKSKEIKTVLISARYLDNNERNTQPTIEGFIVDVSEKMKRERAEQDKKAAEAANHAKSIFIANISHELRTPLNVLLGMTTGLLKTSLEESQIETVRILKTTISELIDIINNILDLSKIEAGQLMLESTNFNLKDILDNVHTFFKGQLENKPVTLQIQMDNKTPTNLYGDKIRLKQILNNLISNAIKFTSKGHIKVGVRPSEAPSFKSDTNSQCIGLLFSVEDSGIGIQKEKQEKIFLTFQQAEEDTSRKYGGTGLGLAICKEFCELMGGGIWVDSEPDKGSIFYFSVFLEPSKPDDNSNDLTEKAVQIDSDFSLSILLVEDFPNNQIVFLNYLSDTPHQVDIAENGQIAYDMFKAKSYHIVFMDIQMPVMDGFEATQKIREWEKKQKCPPTPIIALTARALKDDIEKFKEVGCTAHLLKPFNELDLLDILNANTVNKNI